VPQITLPTDETGSGTNDDFLFNSGASASHITVGPDTKVALTSLQLWDTAGGERHNALAPMFFRGADACILVCDVTSSKSLAALAHWADEFGKHSGGGPIGGAAGLPVMVVANKADLPAEKRAVSEADIEAFCAARNFVRVAPLPEAHERALRRLASGTAADTTTVNAALPSPAVTESHSFVADEAPAAAASPVAADAVTPAAGAAAADGSDAPPTADGPEHLESLVAVASANSIASSGAPPPPPLATASPAASAGSAPLRRRSHFHVFATATDYASAETVFATLAIEVITRRAIAAIRRESRNASFAGGNDGDDPGLVPSHAVKLAAKSASGLGGGGGVKSGGAKTPEKKRRFKC